MGSEATRAKAIGGMSHVFAMATGAITDMIFTGVYERFPDLQVAWIETGVGWIPHFLECLDDRWWRNRVWGDLPLKQPPSFYWHRNNAASFIVDRTGIELRNRVGVENIMWSSDYPHHGNDWPYSRKTIEEMMGGINETERTLITGANAARIWHLGE
jgi:predicted TIM-barrel fold metal-dependent hydrolase